MNLFLIIRKSDKTPVDVSKSYENAHRKARKLGPYPSYFVMSLQRYVEANK